MSQVMSSSSHQGPIRSNLQQTTSAERRNEGLINNPNNEDQSGDEESDIELKYGAGHVIKLVSNLLNLIKFDCNIFYFHT